MTDDIKNVGRIKPAPLFSRAGLIFDPTKLSITSETETAILSLYEWRLLNALVEQEGKAVSYDELGIAMSEDRRPRSKNQLANHVFEQREKLARLSPFLNIRNVENIGYGLNSGSNDRT
ncbi:MAG: hypothetical protein G01um10148_851 [Parcubacteria group bacterium Gr01-1014_8]|nr:MAG: hypothetical protein G01um10148_851 [Parcubacteria group bacterium Gr01-1014_8]